MSYGEHEIERDVRAAGHTGPRLTPADIDKAVKHARYHVFEGTTLTVCCLTLRNGFSVIGYSAAAAEENFDKEIGEKVAYADARDKIWALEGYLLRQRLHEQRGHHGHELSRDAVDERPEKWNEMGK